MDQNLKWAKEPDLYWLQAPLLKEPKNSPLVHYPLNYHHNIHIGNEQKFELLDYFILTKS